MTESASDRTQRWPSPYWLGVVSAGAAVLVTVGWVPSVLMVGILLSQRFVIPERRVVASAALACLIALPILWFVGSSLPFTPPAPRIRDNTWVHQMGGLAVWLLFIAAWIDRDATPPHAGADEKSAALRRGPGSDACALDEKEAR